MSAQPSLFEATRTGLCDYGIGTGRGPLDEWPCNRPATHRARCHDSTGDRHGSVECCRDHANYYATAWLHPILLYAGTSETQSVWVEPIGARA